MSMWSYFEKDKLKKSGKSAKGIVFDFERSINNTRDLIPVIRFTTDKNEWITFKSEFGEYPSPYKEGDEVEVLYDPENPNNAEINSLRTQYYLPILFFVFGIVSIGYGIYYYL